jgi:hypothetical protein
MHQPVSYLTIGGFVLIDIMCSIDLGITHQTFVYYDSPLTNNLQLDN